MFLFGLHFRLTVSPVPEPQNDTVTTETFVFIHNRDQRLLLRFTLVPRDLSVMGTSRASRRESQPPTRMSTELNRCISTTTHSICQHLVNTIYYEFIVFKHIECYEYSIETVFVTAFVTSRYSKKR